MKVSRDQLDVMKYEAIKKSPYKLSLHDVLWERAVADSVDFIEQHLQDCLVFRTKEDLWSYAVDNIDGQAGLCMEFGVFRGTSINFFAKRLPDQRFHGFDSFEGLQEDWKGHHAPKGRFSLKGALPKVESNVSLIKGWFNQVLPGFLDQHPGAIRLVHIDCDTFESSSYVLNDIAPRLRAGTLIVFDEFHGYPNWRNGEFLAWQNAVETFGIDFDYMAFAQNQALVRINGMVAGNS